MLVLVAVLLALLIVAGLLIAGWRAASALELLFSDHSTSSTSEEETWYNADIECAICNKEWQATYPASASRLECPRCGYMNDAPKLDDERSCPYTA
jgi:DNA-directed RNA polymerase subunit RPC12/RpoP